VPLDLITQAEHLVSKNEPVRIKEFKRVYLKCIVVENVSILLHILLLIKISIKNVSVWDPTMHFKHC